MTPGNKDVLSSPEFIPQEPTASFQPLKALLKTLENAYNTCFDCGHKHGVYSVGCSSVHESKCDVCGETKPVTEARDFGYFIAGIRKLKREIMKGAD